jgi:hypothetical protein
MAFCPWRDFSWLNRKYQINNMENNKIDDGGSAFPLAGSSDYSYAPRDGMSLRDWFAAEIMPAIYTKYFDQDSESGIAIAAYRMADAMLAARKESELETESRKLETELNEMRSLFTSYVLCEEAWRNESTDNKVNAVMEANFMREKAKQLLKL